MKRTAWIVLAAAAAGLVLRSLRLAWQPLWWDEGYSVYFATEPFGRMLWLTAHDIHPPLYYALLGTWFGAAGISPETGRILSILLGAPALPLVYLLARAMFPHRRRTAWLALLLLAFSPIHLYYSQEVRMYGLAVTLGLAASYALWHWAGLLSPAAPAQATGSSAYRTQVTLISSRWGWGWAAAYLLAGAAALYTLYYAALLLCAHAAWALLRLRRNVRGVGLLLGVYAAMLLLYLPWLLYAVPQLVEYVGAKVQSDQDTPLGPLAYVERHLVAFTAGPVQWRALPAEWLALAPATLAICAIILGLVLVKTLRPARAPHPRSTEPPSRGAKQRAANAGREGEDAGRLPREVETGGAAGSPTPAARSRSAVATAALWTWLAVPMLLGWLINLRLPFFPTGGERLLLVTLPYLLLLLAFGIDRTWKVANLGKVAAGAMALNAVLGILAYYTTPRYTADDYRPLIRQVVQQGGPADTLLAVFPWQVGYWRAYTAPWRAEFGAEPVTPAPLLLADGAVAWSPQVQARIDAALEAGALWFPEPLTFGSSLPHEIEQHLADHAVNLENRWYDATRLTAWAQLPELPAAVVAESPRADFGGVRLLAAGTAPAAVAGANAPVAATLVWQGNGLDAANISLRLQDTAGHVWTSREYAAALPAAGETSTETVGLIVPVGLPPGGYQVAVSVQTAAGQPLTLVGSDLAAAVIGELEVTGEHPGDDSAAAANRARLPIRHPLPQAAESAGLRLLGYSGPGAGDQLLAGTELAVTLFFEKLGSEPQPMEIYLSLLDANGAGVGGYEGWPLPHYPTAAWPEGALVQVPVGFHLSGALGSGSYRLVGGFRDPQTGEKSPPVELAQLAVVQRPASFTRPAPEQPFAAPPQLGTHAKLLGYAVAPQGDGQTRVRLYWEVLQPLLPPHHIFVHLDAPDGQTIAQADGPPVADESSFAAAPPAAGAASTPPADGKQTTGLAPTGSWRQGEFLTTEHLLGAAVGEGEVLRVGLYNPENQVRLPVTVNGQAAGDSIVLP